MSCLWAPAPWGPMCTAGVGVPSWCCRRNPCATTARQARSQEETVGTTTGVCASTSSSTTASASAFPAAPSATDPRSAALSLLPLCPSPPSASVLDGASVGGRTGAGVLVAWQASTHARHRRNETTTTRNSTFQPCVCGKGERESQKTEAGCTGSVYAQDWWASKCWSTTVAALPGQHLVHQSRNHGHSKHNAARNVASPGHVHPTYTRTTTAAAARTTITTIARTTRTHTHWAHQALVNCPHTQQDTHIALQPTKQA